MGEYSETYGWAPQSCNKVYICEHTLTHCNRRLKAFEVFLGNRNKIQEFKELKQGD